jgi:uncharacterized protein YneF (UPF0154 family)
VKPLLPVVSAGGTFAISALAGMLLGIWIAGKSGRPLWVLGGLLAGMAAGAYAAARLLLRSL